MENFQTFDEFCREEERKWIERHGVTTQLREYTDLLSPEEREIMKEVEAIESRMVQPIKPQPITPGSIVIVSTMGVFMFVSLFAIFYYFAGLVSP